jgi:hypothetical protein
VTKLLFKFLVLLALCAGAAIQSTKQHLNISKPAIPHSKNNADLSDLNAFKEAFANQRSNFQVKQMGQVIKVLREDNHGSRHQRFIVQLASGQKILIAHNIDLASKVENLQEGEMISFYGEYEWNNKGGVVHWTHHDPRGLHPNGWLLYNDRKYD